ncbi:MAG: capsule assembly Wzi family protein [Candidatus Marinimicrobia bacterium]|nr:capsule assembly Wzi family protein [Candidatus Neomarinimicrobiota bacterium]
MSSIGRSFLLLSFWSMAFAGSPYLSLTNHEIYSLLEYRLLNQSDSTGIFILNQPYKDGQIESLLSEDREFKEYYQGLNYFANQGTQEGIALRVCPSLNHYSDGTDRASYVGSSLDGMIRISDALFVNEIELDKKYSYDEDFHGDKREWLTGYFQSSYGIYENKGVELFAGRVSRNFGSLNDYGLILSNNPYAFDHYGFSATGKQFKYSFYTTRLNDMQAVDLQGGLIPLDTVMNSKRFWAIQRLDLKVSEKLQLAFSEATVYGGPDQQFVAAYLNPTHFFYAAQRNQGIQLNSFWQINAFYKPVTGVGIYVDLFADDLIVNNEPGVDDRAVHPDRLGLMLKGSYANKRNTLQSLRYVGIWNETYTSYRSFENYTYFKKGMGYPNNSFEGLKYSVSNFSFLPLFVRGELEVWRQGDRNLADPFHDELNDFPVGPVSRGYSVGVSVSYLWQHKYHLQFDYDLVNLPAAWNNDISMDAEYELQFTAQYYLKQNF